MHHDLTMYRRWLNVVSHFVHQYFIWLLLGSYVVAAVSPGLGLAIRRVTFGEVNFLGEHSFITLPMLMLAFLLLNAGLGANRSELRNLLKSPRIVISGLAANLLIPIAYIFVVSQAMRIWHNPDEVQNILVGLALIAAMPIAGSSTAWTQNANGDIALSLALVLFSTVFSPLTTPIAFDLVERMASGEYAVALNSLESNGTGFLLIACVVIPSMLGILLHRVVKAEQIDRARPNIKLINSINLLLLNYSNAAVSLPQMVADPDWDWLAVTLLIALLLCVTTFAAGWLISRLLHTEFEEQVSLMFGLGMNNNGTGLVLASLFLSQFPRVLLPVILYNLIQHLVAGVVDFVWFRRRVALA